MTTTDTTQTDTLYGIRNLRKDIGVAVVVVIALLLGWLLREYTLGRTQTYHDSVTGFSLKYPAAWSVADSLQDVLLKVESPLTDSAYKTNLTVETRQLDPQNPPTLQQLIDRRVAQHGALTGYHFIDEKEATVDGNKGERLIYAYTVQPIDQPRRVSLPVVVVAREYIVAGKNNVYYITVAAPQNDSDSASTRMDQIIQSVDIP